MFFFYTLDRNMKRVKKYDNRLNVCRRYYDRCFDNKVQT